MVSWRGLHTRTPPGRDGCCLVLPGGLYVGTEHAYDAADLNGDTGGAQCGVDGGVLAGELGENLGLVAAVEAQRVRGHHRGPLPFLGVDHLDPGGPDGDVVNVLVAAGDRAVMKQDPALFAQWCQSFRRGAFAFGTDAVVLVRSHSGWLP